MGGRLVEVEVPVDSFVGETLRIEMGDGTKAKRAIPSQMKLDEEAEDEVGEARTPYRSHRSHRSVPRPANALACLSVHELLEECKRLHLDTTTCKERTDLLELLEDARLSAGWPTTPMSPIAPLTPMSPQVVPNIDDRQAAHTVWDRTICPEWITSRRGKSLYILGLDPSSAHLLTGADLRAAYRRAAMECHPDRNHRRQSEATDLFSNVKEAFDFLRSPAGGICA